ncbi:hypothetical protein [Rhodococcus sp. IEGM 1374]|uniref:hypothetical protein n=1 Tax=Rhodococcus sp. IEGM 1374 TaxID=3082221 RepID=UPI002953DF87|nr:hypothetical protein [Rhodococcus sp. IEGM 1374]MDV7991603.1 hypothetical protein [Rhodococcus sp. IEGM 1374]
MRISARIGAESLFEVCALPGCIVPVTDPAEACASCQRAFGGLLRPTSGPARDRDEIVAELRERDHVVRARYRERTAEYPAVHTAHDEPEHRRNQICWLCEERATCTRQSTGWECSSCATVTG